MLGATSAIEQPASGIDPHLGWWRELGEVYAQARAIGSQIERVWQAAPRPPEDDPRDWDPGARRKHDEYLDQHGAWRLEEGRKKIWSRCTDIELQIAATPTRTLEGAVVVAATLRFVKVMGGVHGECEDLEVTLGKNLAAFVEAQAAPDVRDRVEPIPLAETEEALELEAAA